MEHGRVTVGEKKAFPEMPLQKTKGKAVLGVS
jgi:hypothetical protein